MKRIAIVLLLLAGQGVTARAETAAGDVIAIYDREPHGRAEIELILRVTENGFSWSNAVLKGRGSTPLYCAPGKVVFTGAHLLEILRHSIREQPKLGSAPVSFALLKAMESTYRCAPTS